MSNLMFKGFMGDIFVVCEKFLLFSIIYIKNHAKSHFEKTIRNFQNLKPQFTSIIGPCTSFQMNAQKFYLSSKWVKNAIFVILGLEESW